MKTWLYFYIEHTLKNGMPFHRDFSWALWLKSNFLILSGVVS